jgi:hypothetical protein
MDPNERTERLGQVKLVAEELFTTINELRSEILGSVLFPLVHQLMQEIEDQDGRPLLASPSDFLLAAIDRMLEARIHLTVPAFINFRRARGMLITQNHSWFVVEALGKDVGDPAPWWRYIIDPAFPDTRPQCVLIGPGSPVQLAYRDRRDEPVGAAAITDDGDADRT